MILDTNESDYYCLQVHLLVVSDLNLRYATES